MLFVSGIIAGISSANAAITNGDFSTGDYSGWMTDTDGMAGSENDFFIQDIDGGYRAEIQVDYWNNVPNDAFIANTLYQEMDLTVDEGYGINLSFDWEFTGEDGDLDIGDYWFAAFGDGSGNYYDANGDQGFLVEESSEYGAGSFAVDLGESLLNQNGWTIEFQLLPGLDSEIWDVNYLGSSLFIDNVSLSIYELPVTEVPEPPFFMLAAFGVLALIRVRRRSQK